ncbi:transposase domain-containing protein [Bradyrhizobium sp. CCBAU 11386]|uniref:transposase domain-containing protein n=1 Tax=Bradyrhizobium sp. CCBAU 11386 TaxID=1630837 RepID=UPI003FA43FB9
MDSLILTGKIRGVAPPAWLVDVLTPIRARPPREFAELLPWDWISALAISWKAQIYNRVERARIIPDGIS